MNDRAALKAGIFIVLMLALAVGMVVAISGTGSLLQDVKRYVVQFESGENVANLRPDAQVRVLGVPTGRVEDVRAVATDDGAVVQVDINLPAEFTLRDDATIRAAASLTGDAWLDIDHMGQGTAVAEGGTLNGSVLGVGQLLEEARQVIPAAQSAIERIDAAAAGAEEFIASARGQVDPVLASVSRFTEHGGDAAEELSGLLGETKGDLRGTIASLRQTLDTARDRLPKTMDRVDATLDDTRNAMADAKAVLADARSSLDRINVVLDEARPATADARAMIADLRQTVAQARPKLDRTLANLSRASDDASGAMVEIRAAPWRLLNKPTAEQDRNLALYSLARQYARGAQDLESAARALQTAGQTIDADDETLARLQRDLASRHERFGQFEQDLWDALQD
ncbi:MAG: MlaD family protein [Planctomycetota bacterium]